jgi:hypothetical protein
MMNGTFFMLMSGAGTMSLKKFAGAPIDTMCLNYLGNKKGYVLQVVLYVGMFFAGQRYLMNQKIFDINHFVNPREKNGEIMLNIFYSRFPMKVDMNKM